VVSALPSRAAQSAWNKAFAGTGAIAQLPFDLMRAQYAQAVRNGLVERSLLAAGRFERDVATLERMTLGPLARSR
jgi:hypothetical protein